MHTPEAKVSSRFGPFLSLVAAACLLVGSAVAGGLKAVHLPGGIAGDAQVGLAVSAPDTLYAAYWVGAGRGHLSRLLIYKFNTDTGEVLARSELDKAEPLRSRDGDVVQSSVQLSLSPDRSVLLCTSVEGVSTNKAWIVSTRICASLAAERSLRMQISWDSPKPVTCVCSVPISQGGSGKRSVRRWFSI